MTIPACQDHFVMAQLYKARVRCAAINISNFNINCMNTYSTQISIPVAYLDIHNLDFSMVSKKLQDPDEGKGWTPTETDIVEADYKRFLALKREYPEKDIVPNQLVDAFWHAHILDTAKYAKDCEAIFGFFLHHFPYFGMNGPEDAENLKDAFAETCQLFSLHFGIEYAKKGGGRARCRTQCKPVKCK